MEAAPALPSLADLNAATVATFVAAVSPLFEGAPRYLDRLAAGRPYRSADDLFERAAAIALDIPETDRIELLDAHPRIGAPPGSMSLASRHEQGHGPAPVPDAVATAEMELARQRVQADLDRLNAAYESRFGFRFVVFVAGRRQAEIVPLMEVRLGRDRDAEMRAGLADVVAIARDRWRKGT